MARLIPREAPTRYEVVPVPDGWSAFAVPSTLTGVLWAAADRGRAEFGRDDIAAFVVEPRDASIRPVMRATLASALGAGPGDPFALSVPIPREGGGASFLASRRMASAVLSAIRVRDDGEVEGAETIDTRPGTEAGLRVSPAGFGTMVEWLRTEESADILVLDADLRLRWRAPSAVRAADGSDNFLLLTGAGGTIHALRVADGVEVRAFAPEDARATRVWSRTDLLVFQDDPFEEDEVADEFFEGHSQEQTRFVEIETGRERFRAPGMFWNNYFPDSPVSFVEERPAAWRRVQRRFDARGGRLAEIEFDVRVGEPKILAVDDELLLRLEGSDLVCETIAAPIETVWRAGLRFPALAADKELSVFPVGNAIIVQDSKRSEIHLLSVADV